MTDSQLDIDKLANALMSSESQIRRFSEAKRGNNAEPMNLEKFEERFNSRIARSVRQVSGSIARYNDQSLKV